MDIAARSVTSVVLLLLEFPHPSMDSILPRRLNVFLAEGECVKCDLLENIVVLVVKIIYSRAEITFQPLFHKVP